jgi:DNA-binding winged helix-turn-helix (wHTH) protein
MVFVFGECTLDVARRELRRAGIVRPLEPKAFLVLVHLLTQRHRAVSKDELLATCWPNEFVTEAALTRCLRVIRQAVADDGVQQYCIRTLRGYGYRFVAAVEERATRASDNPLPQVESARPRCDDRSRSRPTCARLCSAQPPGGPQPLCGTRAAGVDPVRGTCSRTPASPGGVGARRAGCGAGRVGSWGSRHWQEPPGLRVHTMSTAAGWLVYRGLVLYL